MGSFPETYNDPLAYMCQSHWSKAVFNFVYFKQDHVAVPAELDLVEEEDQITHLLRLEEAGNTEDILRMLACNYYCNIHILF